MFPPDALPPLVLRPRVRRHRHRALRRVLQHAAAAGDARERRRHRHALRARRHPARHAVRLLDCRPHVGAHRARNLVRFRVRYRCARAPGARAGGCVPPPHCERHDGAAGLPVLRGPLHQRDAGTPRGLRGRQSVHGGQRRRRVGPVTFPSMRVRVPRGAVRQAACAGDRPGRPHHPLGDPRRPELRLLWVGARDSRAVAAVIDVKLLRAAPGEVRAALARRGDPTLVRLLDELEALDMRRRALTGQLDQLKADRNEAAKADARLMKEKGSLPPDVRESRRALGERIDRLEAELKGVEEALDEKLLYVPNLPLPDVPDGDASHNKIVRTWGEPAPKGGKPHWEIGEQLGLLDLARGAKISGSGFPVFMGPGSKLVRALINFMLDLHTREHGYVEVEPPFAVKRATMQGTGQVPKFADEAYKTAPDDLFLIPTAEVPVTNLHRDEILDGARL